MGIAVGIVPLDGTEPKINLGVITPPPNCNVHMEKYHCNMRVKVQQEEERSE